MPINGLTARSPAARAAMPPADMFWGDRYAQVVDPFRFRSAIGSPVKGQPSTAAGTA